MRALYNSWNNFIWFWPSCCVCPVFEGESPPPISTPCGACSGAASHSTLNLLVFHVKNLCIHSPASLMRKSCSKLAEMPEHFCWQICFPFLLADFLTVSKSANRFTPLFCWQIWSHSLNLLADLLTGRFGESAGRFAPISAGKFSDSQQIC